MTFIYAYSDSVQTLPIGGIYRYRNGGEKHAFEGKLIHLLQTAVSNDSYQLYKKFSNSMQNFSPINVRDLLEFKESENPIDISEVRVDYINKKRFGTGSMSHGALSKEAHETLAIAMNRIGGASCSGEEVGQLIGRLQKKMVIQLTQESSKLLQPGLE